MGKITLKNYDVSSNINKKIVVISDIHYYSKYDMKKLDKVIKKIENIKPDFICIPGDIVDEAKVLDLDLFIEWLTNLACICKVVIALGNHELFITKGHIQSNADELIKKIRKINNIIYLDNSIYTEDNINFMGITMPFDYYYKLDENKDFFINFFNSKFKKIDNKYNILLCHSPICIGNKRVFDKLIISSKLDLVLSGHMHGGITPNFLKTILRGRGIISPRRKLLEKNCYGYHKINNTNFIISSGITVASHMNRFRFLDKFFSSEITVINLK